MRSRRITGTVLGLAALGAGVIAGCGTGTGTHPGTTTSTTRPQTTTTVTTVTTVTSASTPTADLPGTGRPRILLGDLNTPEQFILGELYSLALSAQGYTVQLSRNIGPLATTQAAVAQGSLDVYPEYIDVYDSEVAQDTRHFIRLADALDAGQRYARRHGETLLTPTPFSDTAGIAVLSSYARAHHLHSIADLRHVAADLTLGEPAEFSDEINQPDPLALLERGYHFQPALTTRVSLGTQYRGLTNGSLQAAYDQTTDPELSQPNFTDLGDPAHVLGFGNVVPVVSTKVMESEGPAFSATLNQVDALLTIQAIRGLVAETAGSSSPAQASAEVANEFLQGYGIVSPPPWSTVSTTTPQTLTTVTDAAPLTSTGRLSATSPAR